MSGRKYALVLVSAVGTISLLAGCGGESSTKVSPGAAQYQSANQLAPSNGAVRVAKGRAPLNHMVAPEGYLFVKDLNTGKMLLDKKVGANTLVQIDREKGIALQDKNVVGGPLPLGHEYELWLDRTPVIQKK